MSIPPLLPLRLFLGGTFLYAGVDKLVSPTFLVPGAPDSIQAQLAAFARMSPLGDLVRAAAPEAVLIGVAIALVEMAVGVGAITGLAFRTAAAGGLALSLLFFLTASWATRPFYYGADLPFAAGWLTLLLSGRPGSRTSAGRGDGRAEETEAPRAITRRAVVETVVVGGAALLIGALVAPLRSILGATARVGAPEPSGEPVASAPPGGGDPGSGQASGVPLPGLAIGTAAAVARRGSFAFRVPFSAPSSLPAGDPAIVVRLADGSFAAFDAVCTHAGCTVGWDAASGTLVCPCHGAAFDPAAHGAVLAGPAVQPLVELPIAVDAGGTIRLVAT